MELSAVTLQGLAIAGNSTHIPENCFNSLVSHVCEGILQHSQRSSVEEDPVFQDVNQSFLKAAYGGLSILATEASKHDAEEATISSLLEDCKFSNDRVNSFTKTFLANKSFLQILLGSSSRGLPHVVDVNWRLDYYLKNNQLDKVNEPVYLLSLKTEIPGSKDLEDVQFACTMEQMQDLVGKLKDATKCLEKIGQL